MFRLLFISAFLCVTSVFFIKHFLAGNAPDLNEESINAAYIVAIQKVLNGYPQAISVSHGSHRGFKSNNESWRTDWFWPEKPIYYLNVNDFIMINANCCHVTGYMPFDYPSEFIVYFYKKSIDFVEVKKCRRINVVVEFYINYFGVDGLSYSGVGDDELMLSNCGEGWVVEEV
ncbi:hypothetical protein [Iodobacter fluviatilis]|uniref:Uncharacterized protein n=1 Tax=Iodobacter fluviatilis TaxID=537 RepID=A0A7G3G6E1_9NEIS|nr:hypothetical protein [Iodobacter fluviatilis]QBC42385.1 hypothetical protein C1H71_01610 [Iodobacter fluviatilis]